MAETSVNIKLTVKQKRAVADLKQFGNEVKGLATKALTLGGALGGIGFGALAGKAVITAARTQELGIILDVVRENAGIAKEPVDQLVESVKALGITTQVSRGLVADMISTELDLAKATELANVARNAATFSSENTSQALKGLLHGVLTLQPEVLRMRHVFVNLETEYKKFADSTNRTVQSLSMHEKQQIALNAVIEAGKNIEGAYEAAMGNVRKQIGSLSRYFEEMFNELGEIGLPALEEGVQLVKEMANGIGEWAKENKELLKQDVAQYAADLADKLRDLGGWLKEHHGDLLLWSKIIVATAIIAKVAGIARAIAGLVIQIKAAGWAAAGAAGPIGLIAAGIAGLTALVLWQQQKAVEHERELNRLGTRYKELASKTELTAGQQEELIDVTERLNGILPEHAQKLEAVAGAYDKVEKSTKAALDAGAASLLEKIKEVETKIEEIRSGARAPGIGGISQWKHDLKELQAQLEALTAPRDYFPGEIYGPPKSLMQQPIPEPDFAAAKSAWAEVLDALHEFRIRRLGEDAEKETQKLVAAYRKQAEDIAKVEGLSAEDRLAALMILGEDEMVELKKIHDKQLKEQEKAAKEKAKAEADVVMEELRYKQRLYAWDTENLIAELEKRLAAEIDSAELRIALEEELAKLRRERAVEVADSERAALDAQRESGVRLWEDVGSSAKSTLAQIISDTRDAHSAWENFGDYLKNRFVDYALDEVFKMIQKIKHEMQFVGPRRPGEGMGFWDFVSAAMSFLPLVFMQHGGYVDRPRLAMVGEGDQDEIVSPVPMMRQIIREELAIAGGGGGIHIDNVNAIDAASFEDFMHRTGVETLERMAGQGWYDPTGKRRHGG